MWTFFLFFPPRISFHTMCVLSIKFRPPCPALPLHSVTNSFFIFQTGTFICLPFHTLLTVVTVQPQLICTLFLFCFGVFLQTKHEDSPLRCRVQLGCFSRWFVYTLWVQCWIFLISISVDYCSIFCYNNSKNHLDHLDELQVQWFSGQTPFFFPEELSFWL